MRYYLHYLGDYAKNTGHLSLVEHGAYLRLMHHYYSTEKPIPTEKRDAYRICNARTKAERTAVDSVLSKFFECHITEGYRQRRIDAEIERLQYQERRRKASKHTSDSSVRERIFTRDGFKCVWCPRTTDLTVDHVKSILNGGSDDDENLQTLCRSCNSRKGGG